MWGTEYWAPKIHILIFGTLETVTMHSNKVFEDVIYVKFLSKKIIVDYPGGCSVLKGLCKKWK